MSLIPALAEEQIRASVDEELDASFLCGLANRSDPVRLAAYVVKPRAFNDPVLEINADHPEIEQTCDIAGELIVVVTVVTPFEIDSDREIYRGGDLPDNLLGKCDRDKLTIAVTLRLGDRPAAGRDRLCTRIPDSFRTAGILRIVK